MRRREFVLTFLIASWIGGYPAVAQETPAARESDHSYGARRRPGLWLRRPVNRAPGAAHGSAATGRGRLGSGRRARRDHRSREPPIFHHRRRIRGRARAGRGPGRHGSPADDAGLRSGGGVAARGARRGLLSRLPRPAARSDARRERPAPDESPAPSDVGGVAAASAPSAGSRAATRAPRSAQGSSRSSPDRIASATNSCSTRSAGSSRSRSGRIEFDIGFNIRYFAGADAALGAAEGRHRLPGRRSPFRPGLPRPLPVGSPADPHG